MSEKPTSVTQVTEEEVEAEAVFGPKRYKWEFPEKTFDGRWWDIGVPNTKVNSAINSFRNQCESVYRTRAQARRGRNGAVFVRRLVDKPVDKTRSEKDKARTKARKQEKGES